MALNNLDLAALVSSRICHDLISPIGAINNGLELLNMSGLAHDGPEIQLIGDSVKSARARIRFFRITLVPLLMMSLGRPRLFRSWMICLIVGG